MIPTRFLGFFTAVLLAALASSAAPGDLKWSYRTGGSVRSSPAMGTNGWIVFGSFDRLIYAVTPDTGELKWKTSAAGPVVSSPAISNDGLVFIGTTNGLLALDGSTGSQKWLFRTNAVYATPTLGGDGVYCSSERGVVFGLEMASGALRWSTNMFIEFFPLSACYSSPILTRDGSLILGAASPGVWSPQSSFRSIDSASGEVRWVVQTVNAVQSSAAIAPDGTVFVCGFDKIVNAIDPATGASKWSRLIGDSISSSPALGPDGTLYVGANDGYLYALDAQTGSIKWKFLTGDSIHSSPAVAADGTVYFGSHDKSFYALDGHTGSRKWSFPTQGFVLSSPLIGADGTVYIGSYDSKLYALEGSAPPAAGWSMFKGNPRRTGSAADTLPVLLANPRFDSTGFVFDLHSTPGKSHIIEYSHAPDSPGWIELTNTSVTANSTPISDPTIGAVPSRYYRVRSDQL